MFDGSATVGNGTGRTPSAQRFRPTEMLVRPAFFLLATATALQGPAPTGRRACIARTRPASACLGELLGNDDPLQALDELKPTLSYGGWQRDAAAVEDDLVRCGPSVASRLLARMRRKQRLHEGDLSDVVLQVLDDVKRGLSYTGWEADVDRVQRDWAGGWDTNIEEVVDKMRRKQLEYTFRKFSATGGPSA